MRAVAWSELGDARQAAAAWEKCLRWAQRCLPPNDENEAVYAMHAAVCRLAAAGGHGAAGGEAEGEAGGEAAALHTISAVTLVARAREVHEVAHGGGAAWMAIRYRKELLEAEFFPEAAARAWDMISA
jgi:hypothetical protein